MSTYCKYISSRSSISGRPAPVAGGVRGRLSALTLLVGASAFSGCAAEEPAPEAPLQLETQFVERAGSPLPRLPPAVGEDESRALLTSFDWRETEPLLEYNRDGSPALHYVMIYVDDRQKVAELEEMQLHHAYSPLLQSERSRWKGMRGQMTPSGDGRGVFAFAFIPGVVYNMIRTSALEGEVLYQAILPRELPLEALNDEGSISYEQLGAAGFRYDGQPLPSFTSSEGVGQAGQPLVILTARTAMKAVAEAAIEAARLAAKAVGNRDRNGLIFGVGAAGTAHYYVDLNLMNTDSLFGGDSSDPATPDSTPMRRAWGEGRGDEIYLEDVRVSIWSHGDSTVLWLPTLFDGHTDDEGKVHIEVAKDREIDSFCVAVENDAAELTELLTEVEMCDFDLDVIDNRSAVFIDVDVQHSYFNVLAQLSEGRAYLEEVVGYTPYKTDVLVGPIADMLGSVGSAAFVPCLGFPNVSADALVAAILAPIALVSPSTAAFLGSMTPIMAVDMVLGSDSVKSSRGVATHEYGHFVMCSMLFDEAVWKISTTWTSAVVSRLSAGTSPSADADASYTMEAFADFFAGQVAGAANYADVSPLESGSMDYCVASDDRCFDQNMVESNDFHGELGRVLTTMHDAFDGWARHEGNVPSNADVWEDDGAGLYTPASISSGNAYDESVKLPGHALRTLVGRMGAIDEDSLMSGLAATIREEGYDWCDACEVFALHDSRSSTGTREEKYITCEMAPIAGWLGAAPDATDPTSCNFRACPEGMGLTVDGCVTCGEGTVSDGRSPCEECPDGSVVVDNQCVSCDAAGTCTPTCPGRTGLDANGECVDCAVDEVSVDSQCEPCPAGMLVDPVANECVVDCPPGTAPQNGACAPIVL